MSDDEPKSAQELFEWVQKTLDRNPFIRADGRRLHYILNGHEVVPVDDLLLFAMWYEDGNRIVKQEQIGEYWVSTVFLGLDHNWGWEGPPVLFETMIFIDEKADVAERYCTWDEAAAGHDAICERLRESG